MQPLQRGSGHEGVAASRQSMARPFRDRPRSHWLCTEYGPPGCQRVLVLSAGYRKSSIGAGRSAQVRWDPLASTGARADNDGYAEDSAAPAYSATTHPRVLSTSSQRHQLFRSTNPREVTEVLLTDRHTRTQAGLVLCIPVRCTASGRW